MDCLHCIEKNIIIYSVIQDGDNNIVDIYWCPVCGTIFKYSDNQIYGKKIPRMSE